MLIKGADKLFKVAQMSWEEQQRYRKEQYGKEKILEELKEGLIANSEPVR